MKSSIMVAVTVLLVAGCGSSSPPGVGTSTSTEPQASCDRGTTTFPQSLLYEPQYTPEEFAATPEGKIVTEFFTNGDGAEEDAGYSTVDAFSVVSPSLVLGYQDDAIVFSLDLDGDRVRGWGGCRPSLLLNGSVSTRWTPAVGWDRTSNVIPIKVEGGACSTENGVEIVTEIVGIDVTENTDSVEAVVWTQEHFEGLCAGLGIRLDDQLTLAEPLGDRALYDTGQSPPLRVDRPAAGSTP
jgi:hypothetical protein